MTFAWNPISHSPKNLENLPAFLMHSMTETQLFIETGYCRESVSTDISSPLLS